MITSRGIMSNRRRLRKHYWGGIYSAEGETEPITFWAAVGVEGIYSQCSFVKHQDITALSRHGR